VLEKTEIREAIRAVAEELLEHEWVHGGDLVRLLIRRGLSPCPGGLLGVRDD
jgi:hypothetical protein